MLKTYLKSLGDDDARERFAKDCGTTWGHMRNSSYGLRALAPEVCVLAERLSDRAVRRWELRPDDWHLIWPELIGAPGAPKVAKQAKAA
jgi:DNA-binding transcriptional regulator YdaS (Cro superfamily)